MWDVAPWLALAGVVMGAVITLVKIAVAAERRRADDWRDAARTGGEANRVLSANMEKLITSVDNLASSQREILSLLQDDRRGQG